jgi:hypothetical protein
MWNATGPRPHLERAKRSLDFDQWRGIAMVVICLICLAMIGVVIAGLWKVYEKAGEPGWTALVPI